MRNPGTSLQVGIVVLVVVFAVSSLSLYGGARLVAQEAPEEEIAAENGGKPPVPGVPEDTFINLIALNILFDQRALTASVGGSVTVRLDNQDAGVLHNFAFFTDQSASTVIFQGEIFPGPDVMEYTFEAPAAGTYFFRCNVHPDTMTGSFVVQ